MKTLYISDLDGTLLNRDAELSEFAQAGLNRIIDEGTYFSVATARTAATTLQMLDYINLNVPIILMNGVSIYDTQSNAYVKTHYIEPSSVSNLLEILKAYETTGFIYLLEDNDLKPYYENIYSEHTRRFIDERKRKYNKRFYQTDDFCGLDNRNVIYFSVCDAKEKLVPLYQELLQDPMLHLEFYQDVYEDGFWFLEACSTRASKYNAVRFLCEEYGFEKVVAFGDNMNDLPMFRASDECYAVANARPEVKEKSTAVIGGNCEDGVVRWLMERHGIQ